MLRPAALGVVVAVAAVLDALEALVDATLTLEEVFEDSLDATLALEEVFEDPLDAVEAAPPVVDPVVEADVDVVLMLELTAAALIVVRTPP